MSKSVLAGSFYGPGRGGHAPGDLRDAFIDAVEACENWTAGDPEPTVELRDQQFPISAVFGLLWNCSDTLPNAMWISVCDLVDDDGPELRRTYAAAARLMKPMIEDEIARQIQAA